jgi:hypothetical protein
MVRVGHAPFAREEESWGCPAYYPPDPIEPCYKIHGVFNGSFSIIKPASEADVAGLDRFQRYQRLTSLQCSFPVIRSGTGYRSRQNESDGDAT